MGSSTTPRPQLIPTLPAESRAWMRRDLAYRLLPFGALVAGVWLRAGRPSWLGIGAGRLPVQLGFGIAGGTALFAAAAGVQLLTTRVRGALRVPASRADLALQAGYYALNAPIEEAMFRGLLQGGLGAAVSEPRHGPPGRRRPRPAAGNAGGPAGTPPAAGRGRARLLTGQPGERGGAKPGLAGGGPRAGGRLRERGRGRGDRAGDRGGAQRPAGTSRGRHHHRRRRRPGADDTALPAVRAPLALALPVRLRGDSSRGDPRTIPPREPGLVRDTSRTAAAQGAAGAAVAP